MLAKKMTPTLGSARIDVHMGKRRACSLQVWRGSFRRGNSICKGTESQKNVLKVMHRSDAQQRHCRAILTLNHHLLFWAFLRADNFFVMLPYLVGC